MPSRRPAPGCADGTPDTVTGIPTLLPLICNGDDSNAGQGSDPYGVRDALDAFVLATGTTAAAKATTAGSESTATAPAANTSGSETGPQCSDGVDNDGDGLIDAADPGCHSDGNANNPASYVPSDNDESNGTPSSPAPTHAGANNGNGNGAGVKGLKGSGHKPQCSDGIDNDGDNLVDEADPGCHSDGNAHNASSYNPNDDSEVNGTVPASSAGLPFTGTDVLTVALIGALLLAAGIALRTRQPRRRPLA